MSNAHLKNRLIHKFVYKVRRAFDMTCECLRYVGLVWSLFLIIILYLSGWKMRRFTSENRHQKNIYHNKIGSCALNTFTLLGTRRTFYNNVFTYKKKHGALFVPCGAPQLTVLITIGFFSLSLSLSIYDWGGMSLSNVNILCHIEYVSRF